VISKMYIIIRNDWIGIAIYLEFRTTIGVVNGSVNHIVIFDL